MEHKPIYLDGVDVSRCRYFLKDTEGQDYETDEFVKGCCEAKGSCIGYEFAGYGLCRGDKDCYFKQLARKKQEYEELRQYHNKCCKEFENEKQALLEKYNQNLNNFYNGDYCNTEHCSLLKAKEKECEELKERLVRIEEDLKYQCVDCMNCQSDRYRKALEEIEKHIESYKEQCNIPNNCVDNRLCSTCFLGGANELGEYILDIINKVKGEENEQFSMSAMRDD